MMVAITAFAAQVFAQTKQGAQAPAPVGLEAKPCEVRPGAGPEMIFIEAGRFDMGSPPGDDEADDDERPQHQVAVRRPFAIARCETTVGQFRTFVRETGYVTDAEQGEGCKIFDPQFGDWVHRPDAEWRVPGPAQTDNDPVVCVSHNDATAYARWLSLRTGAEYRLPTEAEWEFTARAGMSVRRFWGDDADQGCDFANGADVSLKARVPYWGRVMDCHDAYGFTAPTGSYRRNAFGLSDMLGNAWEWVEDCWHDSYAGAPADGSAWLEDGGGDCARRVLRGGSWYSTPGDLRAASRDSNDAGEASSDVGFRLARTLPF